MIDFEKAVMNAFRDILPEELFFPFMSVQKKIQLKFKITYYTDKLFARAARLVVFLTFVPISDVEEAFFELTFYIQSKYPQLMAIVNYFENTYLGVITPESDERVPPQFPVKFYLKLLKS